MAPTLRTERTKILTWRVDDRHVIEVMSMLRKTENGPFLIHCQHGADRTGLMSAMYRMLEQDWSAEDALAELTDGGYGYHSMWRTSDVTCDPPTSRSCARHWRPRFHPPARRHTVTDN